MDFEFHEGSRKRSRRRSPTWKQRRILGQVFFSDFISFHYWKKNGAAFHRSGSPATVGVGATMKGNPLRRLEFLWWPPLKDFKKKEANLSLAIFNETRSSTSSKPRRCVGATSLSDGVGSSLLSLDGEWWLKNTPEENLIQTGTHTHVEKKRTKQL